MDIEPLMHLSNIYRHNMKNNQILNVGLIVSQATDPIQRSRKTRANSPIDKGTQLLVLDLLDCWFMNFVITIGFVLSNVFKLFSTYYVYIISDKKVVKTIFFLIIGPLYFISVF